MHELRYSFELVVRSKFTRVFSSFPTDVCNVLSSRAYAFSTTILRFYAADNNIAWDSTFNIEVYFTCSILICMLAQVKLLHNIEHFNLIIYALSSSIVQFVDPS